MSGRAGRRAALAQAAGAAFAAAGCAQTDPPIVAKAHVFLERLGERFRQQTCFFEDGTGEELCLRPELTIPACLEALAAGFDGRQALRIAYEGPVFRLTEDGAGGVAQIYQAGAEFLGPAPAAEADAAALALADAALKACGVRGPIIRIGDASAFRDLVNGLNLSARQRLRLFKLFDAYGAGLTAHLPQTQPARAKRLDFDLALAGVEAELEAQGLTLSGGRRAEDVARRLAEKSDDAQALPASVRQAVEAFFALEAPMDQAAKLLDGFFSAQGLASPAGAMMAERAAAFAKAGLEPEHIRFSASIHAPLGFYTGLEFRIEAQGQTLAGGGRYDALLNQISFGAADAQAVGFALFIDALAALQP